MRFARKAVSSGVSKWRDGDVKERTMDQTMSVAVSNCTLAILDLWIERIFSVRQNFVIISGLFGWFGWMSVCGLEVFMSVKSKNFMPIPFLRNGNNILTFVKVSFSQCSYLMMNLFDYVYTCKQNYIYYIYSIHHHSTLSKLWKFFDSDIITTACDEFLLSKTQHESKWWSRLIDQLDRSKCC